MVQWGHTLATAALAAGPGDVVNGTSVVDASGCGCKLGTNGVAAGGIGW